MPSQPARGDKREKILESAIRTFAKRGFHQSRVSDIAQEAGVADGTIYLYFKNKEDLLISIFEEKMGEMLGRMKAELEPLTDPRDRLRRFIEFHLGQLERHRSLAEVLQVELRLSNKFMKEYVPERLGQYLELLSEIICEGQQQGIFRPDVMPAVAKRAIFGAMDELAMHWVLTRGRRFDLRRNADELSGLFLRGLCVDVSSLEGRLRPPLVEESH